MDHNSLAHSLYRMTTSPFSKCSFSRMVFPKFHTCQILVSRITKLKTQPTFHAVCVTNTAVYDSFLLSHEDLYVHSLLERLNFAMYPVIFGFFLCRLYQLWELQGNLPFSFLPLPFQFEAFASHFGAEKSVLTQGTEAKHLK